MKTFKLQLASVECIRESTGEWFSDEITFLGFGISKRGTRFPLFNRALGSFDSEDVSGAENYPKEVANVELADTDDGVSICAWLIERDGGQLSLSTSREQFMAAYEERFQSAHAAAGILDLTPEGRNMYAFGQAMLAMQWYMVERAGQTDRDDDVYRPVFHNLGPSRMPRIELNPFKLEFGGELRYTLNFHYKLMDVLVPTA